MRTQRVRKRLGTAAVGLVLLLLLAACGGGGTGPAPKLAVSHTILNFGAENSTLTFDIRNAGGGSLQWEVAADQPWLGVSPAKGSGGATVSVTADRTDLAPGTYGGNVKVTSNAGTHDILVLVTVERADEEPPEEPPAPEPPAGAPGQVTGLDARGFTLPAGMLATGSGTGVWSFDISDARFMDAAGASALAAALLELAAEFDLAARSLPAPRAAAPVAQAPMEPGYAAAFVLSWDAEESATAYRVYMNAGDGWKSVDVGVDELDDPLAPTFMTVGSFDIGTEARFVVQAFNGDKAGPVSDEDRGVIIAPQKLMAPADDSRAPRQPEFAWHPHPDATGYVVYVTQGGLHSHVWAEALDADTTRHKYPGSSPHAPAELPAGSYQWFVLTYGPRSANDTVAGHAISDAWSFSVGD